MQSKTSVWQGASLRGGLNSGNVRSAFSSSGVLLEYRLTGAEAGTVQGTALCALSP